MKALLPIIIIIAAIGLFFFQVSPLYSEVSLLRAEGKQYDEALKIAEELETVRTGLVQKLDSFSPIDLARLDHFLPRYLDTVRIILDVDGIADRNSIRLNDLEVNAPEGATTNSRAAGSAASKTPYNTVNVSFNFTASYAQGIRFIQDLQRSLRLLDGVSMTVKPSGESSNQYVFEMVMQTYWINR